MRVLVADDHALFRSGLSHILAEFGPEVEITEVGSFDQAMAALRSTRFDLMLTDLLMPGMRTNGNAETAIAGVRELAPATPIVVVSMLDSAAEIRSAVAAGATGFIPKTSTPEVMIEAIKLVLAGGVYLPLSILGPDTVGVSPPPYAVPHPIKPLTLRQKAVLSELVLGKSNKEIANSLNLSEATVKVHLAAIMRALNVRSRTQVILVASQNGLVPPAA
ncbi:MAG: response regulator [Azospirillum sp.]|nr:response regulator [Azospirillum sp.]